MSFVRLLPSGWGLWRMAASSWRITGCHWALALQRETTDHVTFKLNSWTMSYFVCLLLSNQNNCCLMLLSNIQKHEVEWVEVIMVVWQWVARVTSNKSVAISKQGSFALWAHVDLPRSMDCFMMGRGYGFRLLSNRTRNHPKLSHMWESHIPYLMCGKTKMVGVCHKGG